MNRLVMMCFLLFLGMTFCAQANECAPILPGTLEFSVDDIGMEFRMKGWNECECKNQVSENWYDYYSEQYDDPYEVFWVNHQCH